MLAERYAAAILHHMLLPAAVGARPGVHKEEVKDGEKGEEDVEDDVEEDCIDSPVDPADVQAGLACLRLWTQ
jgi:hypothetical protein